MRTATIALLLATVYAADDAKATEKKDTDAAATAGAAENQACDSSKDKMGCAAGLKCAIGLTAEKSEKEKKADKEAATKKLAAEKIAGQKKLDDLLVSDTTAWTTANDKYNLFAKDKKAYTDADNANTACKKINTARAVRKEECKDKGGVGWVVIGAPTKTAPENKDTKYGCLHIVHSWKANLDQAVPKITHKLAAAQTVTTTAKQCTLADDKNTAKLCKDALDTYEAEKTDKATKLAACPTGDDACKTTNAAPTPVTCCKDATTIDQTVTWSVTEVVYSRVVDTTSQEEQWTYKSSTATTDATSWNHSTGTTMTTTGQAATYDVAAAAAFKVNYRTLKTAPIKDWAAATATADYNAGTDASTVKAVKDTLNTAWSENTCVAAKWGTLYTEKESLKKVQQTAPVKPNKDMPKYKWPGITKPTTPKAEAPKTEAPKTEAPKTEAPKTTDKTPKTTDKTTKTEDKKDDAKAAKVPDGPGKCVKEAKCDKEDTATKLMVTCDAVRLGAAALAALAVATTL